MTRIASSVVAVLAGVVLGGVLGVLVPGRSAMAQVSVPGIGTLSNGTHVTVRMVDSVVTVAPVLHNATVASQVGVGNGTVPAGAAAIVKVVANQGTPRTYSLELTSVAVNGQMVAVTGGSPMLSLIGTVDAGNVVNTAVTGLFKKGQRPAAQPKKTAARTPAVTGTNIYVPAGSEVSFVLAGAVAAPQTAVGAPAQTPASGQAGASGVAAGEPGAAAATSGTAGAATGAASSTTVVYENVQYALQSCQREAPHIICQVQITNLRASDLMLNGAGGSYYVDQSGNRQNASARSIANCVGFGACQLLPNIAMAGRFEFVDQDGRATTLTRLLIAENGKAVAQFSGVAIK